jgi:hypothetical protein
MIDHLWVIPTKHAHAGWVPPLSEESRQSNFAAVAQTEGLRVPHRTNPEKTRHPDLEAALGRNHNSDYPVLPAIREKTLMTGL